MPATDGLTTCPLPAGNHEIEPMMHRMRPGKGQGQNAGQGMAAQYDIFKSLNARWPVPQDPSKEGLVQA